MTDKKNKDLKPVKIMQNIYSVFFSYALVSGMELDVFTPLKDNPLSSRKLAETLNFKENQLTPLLYALVKAEILNVKDGIFSNTAEADKYLVSGTKDYMGGLCDYYKGRWKYAQNITESIRTGVPQAKHDWSEMPHEAILDYYKKQYPVNLKAGKQLAQEYNFAQYKHFLDAGGGSGGVAIGACKLCPDLKVSIAELPGSASATEPFIKESGMSDRIDLISVDLTKEPLKGIYDVVVLRSVVHTLAPKDAETLLKNIGQATESGGLIIIIGRVLDNSFLFPTETAAFNLVFVSSYDEGRAFTEKQNSDWLTNAGFTDISVKYDLENDSRATITAQKI